MPREDIYKNICARIFFNTIFLAFTVFGLYLSFCDAYSYQGDYSRILIISIIFSFIMCVLWTGNNIWCNIGLFVFNLLVAIIVVKKCRLIESEFEILYGYIKRQYYIYENLGEFKVNAVRSRTVIAGFPVYEKLAVILIIILIITIAAMALFRLKWNFLLLFPVVLIVGMEMMHGKAPSVKSAIFFVYGISGLLFSTRFDVCGGNRHFWQEKPVIGNMWTRYIIFTIIMAVCTTVASGTGSNTKDKVFIYSKKFLNKQHEMERETAGFVKKVGNMLGKEDRGYLDNSPPDQTGQSVMRVETDKKPLNNIYIKAFSADIYENGRWKPFEEVNPPVSGQDIDMQAYGSIKSCISAKEKITIKTSSIHADEEIVTSMDWIDSIDNFNMDIVPSWSFGKKDSYSPYMYNIDDTDGYQYNCYNMQNWAVWNILSIPGTEMEYYGINDIKEYTLFVYNEYLEVPKELRMLRDYASEIISGNNIGGMCMTVKEQICEDTKYSQELEVLPDGEDYTEYFLFKQKKGYCEHYATAGTLLLRLKGIPARYVSGYMIRPSEFKLEQDKPGHEKYVAYIKDYDAHAWTEVYKEGFGWIPFDMTNPVMEEEDDDVSETPVSSIDNSLQDDFLQDISGSSETGIDNSGEKDNEDMEKELEEDFGLEEDLTGIQDTTGNTKKDKTIEKVKEPVHLRKEIILIIVVLLILFMPFVYIRIKFKMLFKKAEIAKTSNSRIVIYFNLLNSYLAFCGFRGISKLDDSMYAGKIAGILEDEVPVEACGILQRAVFSNKNINSEEEEEVALFIKNVSGRAYKNCKKPVRFIIYILAGRKDINVFTKGYN